MVIPVTGLTAELTEIVTDALSALPAAVAVIVTVPSESAVTKPVVAFTVARD